MSTRVHAQLVERLNELLTRSVYSPLGYFFEAAPYTVEADETLIGNLDALRGEDDRYALMLVDVLESLGEVPEVGAFPLWYRDLNYLSVPYLAKVVLEQLEADAKRIDVVLGLLPSEPPTARATLESMRADRVEQVAGLRAPILQALEREAETYCRDAAEARATRDAILAEAKAKADAARKAARKPVPPKPGAAPASKVAPEAVLSPKERARQAILARRAAAAGGAEAPKAPEVPDPNEEGISAKEKARRQIMKMRAAKAAEASAPAPAAKTPDLLDPDEEGISPKEKAKRKVLMMRAAKAAEAPAPAPAAQTSDLLDPDEPGISSKEKARRQVLKMRASRKAP